MGSRFIQRYIQLAESRSGCFPRINVEFQIRLAVVQPGIISFVIELRKFYLKMGVFRQV